jgi:hypothetical protein
MVSNGESNFMTIYAKWQDDRCPDGYDYDENKNMCFIEDISFGTAKIYYGRDISHTYEKSPHS